MFIQLLIGAIKAVVVVLVVLNLTALMLWFERKGAALIQDRIGANRANIFGIGKRLGLPNFGMVNTILADPIKMFMKEDFVPDGADHFIHGLAPFLALFPVIVTFAVAPMGDILRIGRYTIDLQPANLNVGALYILATIGIGVYGVALSGWSSNNRFALLGGIRATAQMISYEIPLGLAILAVIVTYGSLDLQTICRYQGGVWFGFLPRWGILLQPVSFILLMVAGMAESKRVPFDLPEAESELIAGYFTEYSGGKQAVFMMSDFAEVVLVAMLATTFSSADGRYRGSIVTASISAMLIWRCLICSSLFSNSWLSGSKSSFYAGSKSSFDGPCRASVMTSSCASDGKGWSPSASPIWS